MSFYSFYRIGLSSTTGNKTGMVEFVFHVTDFQIFEDKISSTPESHYTECGKNREEREIGELVLVSDG